MAMNISNRPCVEGPSEFVLDWSISKDAIEAVRAANRLEDVASDYTQLRRSGRGLVGLCPLHSERTGSFHLYSADQRFKCYGCGTGGDVFTLIQKITGLPFPRVVQHLADRAGIDIDSVFDRKEVTCKESRPGQIRKAAKQLRAIVLSVMLSYRDDLHRLERVRRGAGERIDAIVAGAPERWLGELQCAVEAFRSASPRIRRLEAGYRILAFASVADRVRFALRPRARKAMTDELLASGDAGNVNQIKQNDSELSLLRKSPELVAEVDDACIESEPWPTDQEIEEICQRAYRRE